MLPGYNTVESRGEEGPLLAEKNILPVNSSLPVFNYFKKGTSKYVWIAVVAIFALIATAGIWHTTHKKTSPYPGHLVGNVASGVCKPCTFLECERSLCPSSAAFVCTKGAAHDGCASTDVAWINNSVCTDCCDSSQCSSTKPGGDGDELELCELCTADQCSKKQCPLSSPFLCVAGGATGGCTADEYHWPTSLNKICTKCCNAKSCH